MSIPANVFVELSNYISIPDYLALSQLDKHCRALAFGDNIYSRQARINACRDFAFGKSEWEKYYGSIGIAPPIPREIFTIPASKLSDYTLTLIPATVNGKPLTEFSFGRLIERPMEGYATKYMGGYAGFYFSKKSRIAVKAPHWILMGKDAIAGSRGKTRAEQLKMVSGQMPSRLEATVAVVTHFVRSGKRLSASHENYICCREFAEGWKGVVGDFADSWLTVSSCVDLNIFISAVSFRRFQLKRRLISCVN